MCLPTELALHRYTTRCLSTFEAALSTYGAGGGYEAKPRYVEKKEERAAWQRDYYARNRDKIRERQRAYDARNKERLTEARRAWAASNVGRLTEKRRAYYKANKERILANTKAYRKANPQVKQISEARRYARLKEAGGSFTTKEWLALCEFFGKVCLRCGEARPLTIDHVVPVSKGGSNDLSNIQPLCMECNVWKNTKTIDYRKEMTSNA